MSLQEELSSLAATLPEERVRALVTFARFLLWQEEHAAWQQFGRAQFARAYGADEPDYSDADLQARTKP
jgi:hypothetical protein